MSIQLLAVGEAATYFEIFVPPNNDPVNRDVCLIITALYDSTFFEIIDDDMDGDDDDSVEGMLMAGQSYVLYIRDGLVNDDANRRGSSGAKQDGDFFIVKSTNLVFASQSTNSDWQHDWVPATNKTSLGNKFIIYSPPTSYSPRDLNVYAYQDSTTITIKEISPISHKQTGYTTVDIPNSEVVVQRMLHIGEDIIFYHTDGRDLLTSGHTYMVESNKPITVQYGALHRNARDGGGYVPSRNGSSSGDLFYFTVHTQRNREQEIRIVSWDSLNKVFLDRFQAGDWVNVESWELDDLEPGDWVSSSGNINSVFRVRCTEGKRVSVFEANWLETGSPGTSDIASMVSSRNGTTAGNQFLVYMAPPGSEYNVTDPFTGQKFTQASHAFLFAKDTANVTVVDAKTRGEVINRTYHIEPGRYVDCFLTLSEWRSIYNGDGKATSGPERPYLLIEADAPISVFNTNFNDNWMSYFGTSQIQGFGLIDEVDQEASQPGDSISISSTLEINAREPIQNATVEIVVGNGATVISSEFSEENSSLLIPGEIAGVNATGETRVIFEGIPELDPENEYKTETEIVINGNFANGDPVPDQSVLTVETIVSGEITGEFEQAAVATGIVTETENVPVPLFFRIQDGSDIVSSNKDNLGVSFVDYNNDGLEDIFVPGYHSTETNLLYKNNGDRKYELVTNDPIVESLGRSVSSTWADYDNDGDIDVFVAMLGTRNTFFTNNGDGSFKSETRKEVAKYIGQCFNASWVDYDNDGFLDLFVSEFIEDRPNLLYHNDGEGDLIQISSAITIPETGNSLGATWCDYDNDGDMDLFVPNTQGQDNFLYRNDGAGEFSLVRNEAITSDRGYSVGSSWGDYDNDGDMDLFVTNSENQCNFLYQNQGDGTFERIFEGAIANDKGKSQGSAWGDLDNDGDLDLYVTNSLDEAYYLYWNNGDGTFSKDETEPISRSDKYSLATGLGDIDNDGDLDVFVANHQGDANNLYLNNGNDNRWIKIKLVGTNSNRSAIGAKLRLKARINGKSTWQMREISAQTGGGAGSQNSLIAHFGLGDARTIDSLIIEWPSAYRQFETNIASDQLYVIVEEEGMLVTGRVYLDADSSCSLDPIERGIPNQSILINPGNLVVNTDTSGTYEARLPEGQYTISQINTPTWEQICPQAPAEHTINLVPGGGVPIATYQKRNGIMDCSFGCDNDSESNLGNAISLNEGERICIRAEQTFSGSINFQGGGTLVICGTGNISEINFNGGGTLIVSEGASFNLAELDLTDPQVSILNFSDAFITNFTGEVNAYVENHGTVETNSLTMGSQGFLLNTGLLEIEGNLINNNSVQNFGTIEIGQDLENPEGSLLETHCKLRIAGSFNQYGELIQQGYIEVAGSTNLFFGSSNSMGLGAKLSTQNFLLQDRLNGPDQEGASVEIANNTNLEVGSFVSGFVDICDQDGIEAFNGTLATFASSDCGFILDGEPCNDGIDQSAYTGLDFGNRSLCKGPDLYVALGTTALRRGFENDFVITIRNNGPEPAFDVEVEVKIDTLLTVVGSTLEWDTTYSAGSNNFYKWTIAEIPALEFTSINLTDSVDARAPFGAFVETFASAIHQDSDCEPQDNRASSLDEIVGSFDPNDKQVFTQSYGQANYILSTDTLDYKIRFQNVGNYFASRVVIYDTLSQHLDQATFLPGPMSHEGSVILSEDGVLKWTFDNIYLPDSNSNEPESHGFVLFKILPKQDLKHGTVISNSAAIQFDYNEYIYTNEVISTISDRSTIEEDYLLGLRVFPNPVTDQSVVMVASEQEGVLPVVLESLEIYTTSGILIHLYDQILEASIPIQKNLFIPGNYVLKGRDRFGHVYTGRMLVHPD